MPDQIKSLELGIEPLFVPCLTPPLVVQTPYQHQEQNVLIAQEISLGIVVMEKIVQEEFAAALHTADRTIRLLLCIVYCSAALNHWPALHLF